MDAELHPPWCSPDTCQAADGGAHVSVQREIPLDNSAVLAVRLAAMPDQTASIELDVLQPAPDTSPGSRITLPTSCARELIAAVSSCMWAAIGSQFGSTDVQDRRSVPAVALHEDLAEDAGAAGGMS